MTQPIRAVAEIAHRFDAIVFDQWGVLHDGHAPYPKARAAVDDARGRKLGVLSNSGKRADLNARRIAAMGFDVDALGTIMTSGEALYRAIAGGTTDIRRPFAIEGAEGDARSWGEGLELDLVDDIGAADAVLLMGLPDKSDPASFDDVLNAARDRDLPLYCSNPDLTAPRGGGYVMSPGVLAKRFGDAGGRVHLFGKPHRPVFDAMEAALGIPPARILMVGDSLHHDIAGAAGAGWASLLIAGGVHAPDLTGGDLAADVPRLARAQGTPAPDFVMEHLA